MGKTVSKEIVLWCEGDSRIIQIELSDGSLQVLLENAYFLFEIAATNEPGWRRQSIDLARQLEDFTENIWKAISRIRMAAKLRSDAELDVQDKLLRE